MKRGNGTHCNIQLGNVSVPLTGIKDFPFENNKKKLHEINGDLLRCYNNYTGLHYSMFKRFVTKLTGWILQVAQFL